MVWRSRSFALFCLLATVWATPALAQRQAGSLVGAVTDAQGGALGRVDVVATGPLGPVRTRTDSRGLYRLPAVDPGTYSVEAEFGGFGQTREGVVVRIAKETVVDFRLDLSGIATEVEVEVEKPRLDSSASSFDESLGRDLLFLMPFRRTAVAVVNDAPGIRVDSGQGGDPRTANALLLDGVEFRDPSSGEPFVFLNYNWLDQLEVMGPGAPAEYGLYTGAIFNSITRSGGNRHSGLFEAVYSGSRTLDEEEDAADPETGRSFWDLTAQLGGPILKDKLFFFVGAEYRRSRTERADSGRLASNSSPRLVGKLTFRPDGDNDLSALVESDSVNLTGQPLDAENASAVDSPDLVTAFQWRRRLGQRTSAELKYTGWWGYFDRRLETSSQRPDPAAARSVGPTQFYRYNDRARQQLNLSASHYADAFGQHNLRFGLEVERSLSRYRGLTERLLAPQHGYSYGFEAVAHSQRESVFAQDSWRATDRLTVNAGARLDWVRGENPEIGKVYDAVSLQPRTGVAFDLRGDGRSVLKAHYGRYAEAALAEIWRRAVPGYSERREFDLDGNGLPTSQPFPPLLWSRTYTVDPGIRHPRVDEWVAGFEGLLLGDVRLQLFGIWRDFRNAIGTVQPDEVWLPFESTNPLTGEPLQLYAPSNRIPTVSQHLITNPDGFVYRGPNGEALGTASTDRRYQALQLSISKPLAGRFLGAASYVLSRSQGDLDGTILEATLTSFGKYDDLNGALFQTHGELDISRRHDLELMLHYQAPVIELGVGAYYHLLSGPPYAAVRLPRYTPFRPRFALLLEPRGSRSLPATQLLDLRLEKVFDLGGSGGRLGVYADITNLLNADTVTDVNACVPGEATEVQISSWCPDDTPFGTPLRRLAPRQTAFGVRWSF